MERLEKKKGLATPPPTEKVERGGVARGRVYLVWANEGSSPLLIPARKSVTEIEDGVEPVPPPKRDREGV